MKKVIIYLFSAVVLLMGLLWFSRMKIATFWYKRHYLAESPEAQIQKHLSALRADAARLEKIPFFSRSLGTSDASSYLNSMVVWLDDHGKEVKGPLDLSKDTLDDLQGFPHIVKEAEILSADTSWFSHLGQFDYWNFDRSGPFFNDQSSYPVFETPMPDYGNLMKWAQIRLLQARRRGDLDTALKDTRRLAQLIMTNENIVGVMSALAILRDQRKFYDALDEAERNKVKIVPLQYEDLDLAKRFYWAQQSFLDPRLTPNSFELLAAIPVGICQRVSKGMSDALAFRPLMKDEQADFYKRLDDLVQATSTKCRSGFLRKVWRQPEYGGLFKAGQNLLTEAEASSLVEELPDGKLTLADLHEHPKSGVAIGYILMSVAEANYFGSY